MASGPQKKIFANCDRTEFAARETELASILAYADEWKDNGGLLLLCEPGSGASELMAQAADALFSRSGKTVPFYFRFSARETDPAEAARRFAYEFILQSVTFLRHQPSLLSTSPSIDELRSISSPRDSAWIQDLQRNIGEFRKEDIGSLERICLSAPFRAAAAGTKSVLLLDGFHEAGDLAEAFASAFERSNVPFVVAGYRRNRFERLTGKSIDLGRPAFSDAGRIVGAIAERRGVKINSECRDLIAAHTGGNLTLADAWIIDAADRGFSLDSFQTTEQLYAESLFGGRIGRRYDEQFAAFADSHETQRRIISLITDSGPSDDGGIPIELWERRIEAKPKRVRRMVEHLNVNELIDVDSQSVQMNARDLVLKDYLAKRTKLEFEGANRAVVFGKSLGEFIKRAPKLMADVYRQEASLGLRELLAAFNGTEIPTSLIDYDAFKTDLKGETDKVVLQRIETTSSFMRLPKVYFTGDASSLQHSLAEITTAGLTAFAMGFNEPGADAEDTVWIAAEVESKLEAAKDLAEYWYDQLEKAALKCDVSNYRIWLIAPEGFMPDAMQLLKSRNAIGSGRKQIELLARFLQAEERVPLIATGEEYEFVLPMDQDAELIAARAIEDIAKKHSFEPKAVNQIKTALVEAYINASEHSLSPDRKIHQKIRIDDDKIEITISNRGIRLADKNSKVVEFEEGRRGWGLKLMRQLMDDVRVETVDDGTRITMTKYLKPGVAKVVAK